MTQGKKKNFEEFLGLAENEANDFTGLLAVHNPCIINACEHSKGRDQNRCLVDYEFTYLGAIPLPKETKINGIQNEGRLPMGKQPLSAQAYLYTDNSLEVQFYYTDDHDGEEYIEDIEKIIISSSEITGVIKSISLYLEDFWHNDPSEIISKILNALEIKRLESLTHDEHLNCIAVQKIVDLDYENCIYDMLFLFQEGLSFE